MRPMISVSDLSYYIGAKKILAGINLDIREGSFTCIMGPNGAGKSTLIKLICGLYTATGGGVFIDGRAAGAYPRKELAKLVGYVPQMSGADIHFTVEEYVMTGRYPHQTAFGGVTAEDTAVVNDVMRTTGVEPLKDRDISTLSGGERQRVMIATALAQNTRILLLDEPTIFLDPRSTVDLLMLLRKVHNKGVTVVMVTHDVNQALMFGTDHVGIKDGGLVFHTGDVETLIDGGKLNGLFGMVFKKHSHDGVLQVLPSMEGVR